MRNKIFSENVKLEFWKPIRLVGLIWLSLIIIYFLPNAIWATFLKVLFSLFIIIIIGASFRSYWQKYKIMGVFVVSQLVFFVGLLWTPSSFFVIKLILAFLIIIGIGAMSKQIKDINSGLDFDSNQDLNLFENLDPMKIKANLFVLKYGSFGVAEAYSRADKEKEELLKFATKSIKKLIVVNIPQAFPLEFVAGYPDVVIWWDNLGDEQDDILKSLIEDVEDEADLVDDDGMVKSKYLKIIIGMYKKIGEPLECYY